MTELSGQQVELATLDRPPASLRGIVDDTVTSGRGFAPQALPDIESQTLAPNPPRRSVFGLYIAPPSQVAGTFAVVAGLVFAGVAIWPAFKSARDAQKATALAQWSAAREFLEYCESHKPPTPECLEVSNVILAPPPGYSSLASRFVLPEQGPPKWLAMRWMPACIAAMVFGAVLSCLVVIYHPANQTAWPSILTADTGPLSADTPAAGSSGGIRSGVRRRRKRRPHHGGSRVPAMPAAFAHIDTSGDEGFGHAVLPGLGLKRRRPRYHHRGPW